MSIEVKEISDDVEQHLQWPVKLLSWDDFALWDILARAQTTDINIDVLDYTL